MCIKQVPWPVAFVGLFGPSDLVKLLEYPAPLGSQVAFLHVAVSKHETNKPNKHTSFPTKVHSIAGRGQRVLVVLC